MLKSMTGFAAATSENDRFNLRVEVKSVNHRYLDVQCRLPEEFRTWEALIRPLVSSKIQRGKVECRLYIDVKKDQQTFSVDQEKIAAIINIAQDICRRHSSVGGLTVAEILRLPGVIEMPAADEEAMRPHFQSLMASVLDAFDQDRRREGEKLQQHLTERLEGMRVLVNNLQKIFPELMAEHQQKIRQRLLDAVGQVDDERLQQELVLFLQKADVDEEFSRLLTHIDEVERLINQSNYHAIGKKLDFLMQELNREANTLGSKAIALPCTQTAVELKVLIEQMREQVQNIE